jgi:hypothetical protein
MPRLLAVLAVALAPLVTACGEVNSDTPDALVTPADASLDAAPELAHHRYVIDRVLVPRTSDTAVRLDLDADGDTENQLAKVFDVFIMQAGRDLDFLRQGAVDRGIDRGQVILLADVEALDLTTSATAHLQTLEGEAPSPAPCAGDTCRRHLAGGATFTISPASPASSRVDGALVDRRLVGSGGALVLKIPTSPTRTVTFNLSAARVELGVVAETGIQAGIVGGGLRVADFLTEAIPVVEESIRADIAASCRSSAPPCDCTTGSVGASWISLFDTTPSDCRVTESELRNNSLLKALLAPDLDVAPVDGTAESLSVAFGITAVPASWPDAP